MNKIPVIAIFDVGKTNKKLFLFDQSYQIVYEKSARFLETVDEDGFACENIDSLRLSVFESLNEVLKIAKFDIRAINFSTYGASLVYVDANGKPIAPLYNYLKPYPEELQQRLYESYGGAEAFALATASPCSGSLNSGLQLYRIMQQKPEIFDNLRYALHLPQFMSSLISGEFYSDITSIGCHTHLWDFNKHSYHEWVKKEGLLNYLAPIRPSNQVISSRFMGHDYILGYGLHDSSAALIPYLVYFNEPFILISTGTWCISLNPFNEEPLTDQQIQNNCLCYLSYQGKAVKAARLFAGFEHETQSKRIAAHFNIGAASLRQTIFDPVITAKLSSSNELERKQGKLLSFENRDLTLYPDAEVAYHQLMLDIIFQQCNSTNCVLQKSTKRIFVDGGFSKNSIYMNLLSMAFPHIEVYAASMAQATALGTAMSIHSHWNERPLPNDIIDLKYYSATDKVNLS